MPRKQIKSRAWFRRQAMRFHVVFNVAGGSSVLGKVVAREVLRSELGDIVAQQIQRLQDDVAGCIVIEWCVMPTHVHVVLDLRNASENVSQVIGRLKSRSTAAARQAGLWLQRPLWKRGFWERALWTDEEVAVAVRYVRDNPRRWRG